MLFIGLHPQPEMEIWLSRAYNKWMQEKLLSADDRIKFLAVLPYNTPEECERIVTETAGKKGIIGYAVPSTRHGAAPAGRAGALAESSRSLTVRHTCSATAALGCVPSIITKRRGSSRASRP